MPDIRLPKTLCHAWKTLAEVGTGKVFSYDDLQATAEDGRIALSVLEPNRSFYGYDEGVMELWGGASVFADRIDALCAEQIALCRAGAGAGRWREDFITGEILDRFVDQLGSVEVELAHDFRSRLTLRAYKRHIPFETRNGDITFLVVREDDDGRQFAGVGYVEAKRRVPGRGFPELEAPQLRTILASVPQALVALDDPEWRLDQGCVYVAAQAPRAAILPMSHVAALAERNSTRTDPRSRRFDPACRLSTTLGHQIAVRFVNGADLTHGRDLAQAVLDQTESEYLAMIGLGHEHTLEELLEDPLVAAKLEQYADLRTVLEEFRGRVAAEVPRIREKPPEERRL